MNIRQMESFLVLSEELHYGRAAERLEISQPSLSQQIKILESELGVSLFNKQGRNIVLSKAGQLFLRHVITILHEVHEVRRDMTYFQNIERDAIVLGASGSHLLHHIFKQFTEVFPDVMLQIKEYPSSITIRKLLDQQIDIGVTYQAEDIENLVSEPLFEDQFLAVIPKEHELAEKEKIYLSDLENQPLILLEQELFLRKVIDRELQKRHILPNVICELGNHYACLEYCKSQLGIAIIVSSFFSEVPDSVVLKKIEDLSKKETMMLMYRKELVIDEPIRYLLDNFRHSEWVKSAQSYE